MLFDRFLDWFIAAVQKFGAQLQSLVPPVPGWVTDGPGMIARLMGYATALGNWVPLPLFAIVVASVVVCLVAGLGIKVARIAASFLTVGGGSAG